MSALSNAENCQDPCISLLTDAIPEARNSQTGVSVRYVPTPDKRWFVFRASYGREDRAADYLIEDGTYAYVAKRQVLKTVDGKTRKVFESLIPNLLFVYTTALKAEACIKGTPPISFVSYYLDHFKRQGENNPPLTVPQREMENFILATCGRSEHLLFVTPSQCHFRSGQRVRVTDGAFRGVEGRVARVAGQQRVVVNLSGIGLVSTAYIPKAFLQAIGE